MIRPTQQALSARDVCRILFRHRRKSLLFFVAVVAVAVCGVLLMPRKYISEAKFFVKVNLRFDPTATSEGQAVALSLERESEMRSVVALLGSRRLFEQVVDQLGPAVVLETDLQSGWWDAMARSALGSVAGAGADEGQQRREKAIESLMRRLDVSSPKKSHVITLWYESRSPERARQVLEAYVQACQEQHLEVHQNPDSYDFFVTQEQLVRDQVLTAQQELRDTKNKIGLVSLDSQRNVLEQHFTNLDRELLNAETTLASTEDQIENLRGQLPFALQNPQSGSALTSQSIDEMRNQLFTLEINYRDLQARLTKTHPHVRAAAEQLAEAQLVFDQQQLMIALSSAHSLRARREALRQDLDVTHGRLVALNESEVRIAELERRVDELTESHRVYVRKLEQARLDRQLDSDRISNLRLTQAPTEMGKPLSRKGKVIVMLAVLVGLSGALAIAYGAELLDESLVTPADVESQAGVEVLMSLPRSPAHRVSFN